MNLSLEQNSRKPNTSKSIYWKAGKKRKWIGSNISLFREGQGGKLSLLNWEYIWIGFFSSEETNKCGIHWSIPRNWSDVWRYSTTCEVPMALESVKDNTAKKKKEKEKGKKEYITKFFNPALNAPFSYTGWSLVGCMPVGIATST